MKTISSVQALATILAVLFLSPALSLAVDVETLPKGVRMTQARFGVISGLEHTWGSDSNLYNLGQTKSVTFDARTLQTVNDRAQDLIRALNAFGSQGLGNQINLGTLGVSTRPEIQFMAPVLAFGVTDRLTIGVGIPVIRYKNKMSLSAGSSNLEFYRNQFGGISPELDEALNIDLVNEAQEVIASKGYKSIGDRDEQFIGDVQLAVLHRLPTLGAWGLMQQLTVLLPTGPKDNPDDLLAINAFGRTGFDYSVIAARQISRRFTALPYVSALVFLPDDVTKRVPNGEGDTLPDASSKQEVTRSTGASGTVGAEIRYNVISRWTLKSSLESTWKAADEYEGSGRVDLLSSGSSYVQRLRGGVMYSTVEAYQNGEAKLPSRVSLEIGDTLQGRNIERQLRTELSAMLFF